jgi:Tfp pilus assembly protein PilN
MLGTNLATRPFYNERAVRLLLTLLLLLAVALTAWTLVRGLALRDEERVLSARATQALADAERLRAEAARMRAQIDPREVAAVATRAREVNTVIEQRVFSWGALLNDVEAALPDDVRVMSLQPTVEDGGVQILMSVEARSSAALAAFMAALDARGTFETVLPTGQAINDDDTLDAVITAVYRPTATSSPVDAASRPDGPPVARGAEDE